MSFPKYPAYKDSGVEWLGEVPEHWVVAPLKRGFSVTLGKMLQPDANGPDDELLPYLRAANIQWTGVDVSDIKQMWLSPRDRGQLTLQLGDLLVSEGGDVGRSCIWQNEISNCAFQNSVNRVRATHGGSTRYLYYWMSTIKDKGYVDVLCNKSTIAHFTAEKVAAVPVPFPLLPEQTAIATFLDHETAKIDALVAEQEKLINLLQEKRQAVISHAVTKGLNPNSPMKDSGVEWLGEVPEHWEVCALRRVIAAIEQGWSPECYAREAEEQEWGVLKAGCLNGGVFRPSENKALPPELSPEVAYEVRVGDVLMSRASGSPELVGSTALVQATRERIMLSDKIFRLKLNESIDAAFFVAALNSRPLRVQIENALSGGNGMANNLPQSSLLTFVMAVPPRVEQAKITVLLEQETAKLDALITEARTAITLLQERRTALISAAVSGQIDVRNWSAQEGV